jgi:hypothetical protein
MRITATAFYFLSIRFINSDIECSTGKYSMAVCTAPSYCTVQYQPTAVIINNACRGYDTVEPFTVLN